VDASAIVGLGIGVGIGIGIGFFRGSLSIPMPIQNGGDTI